jgi:hypothetical protein
MDLQKKVNEAAVEYYKAKAEFTKKVTPLYIKVNPDYINQMLDDLKVTSTTFIQGFGRDIDMEIDFDGVIPFHSVPVIVDEKVNQYEFVYEGGN